MPVFKVGDKTKSESMTEKKNKKAGIVRGEGPNPVDVFVGARVKKRRSGIRMTQTELGQAIGLTFQQIQKYERGQNRMGAGKLYDVAQTLGVTPSFFFEGIGDGDLTYDLPDEGGAAFAEATSDSLYSSEGTAKEARDVAMAFKHIQQPHLRRKVIDLAKTIRKSEVGD